MIKNVPKSPVGKTVQLIESKRKLLILRDLLPVQNVIMNSNIH